MPAWLISLLVSLAVRFGMPWLIAHLPWLSLEVIHEIELLIEKLFANKMEKEQIVFEAKDRIKKACSGVACPSETKPLD